MDVGAFDLVSDLFIVARVGFVVTTLILFAVILPAYLRFRSRRMLLITIGFGMFLLHGLISIPEIINNVYNIDFTDSLHILFDLAGLVFILLGTVQDMLFKKTQE